MKIINYAINESTQRKIENLLGMEADIIVLSVESCNCKKRIRIPEELEIKWCGTCAIDKSWPYWRGVGVICKKGLGYVPDWFNPDKHYAIPYIINDEYLILGISPRMVLENSKIKSYPQMAQEIIQEYAPHFKDYKTLVIGDFNCCVNQPDKTKKYGTMVKVNKLLKSLGLHSLYHQTTGEALGKETTMTFHNPNYKNVSFFIDYSYTNFDVSTFRLLPFNKRLSNHLGMEVVF